MFFRKPDFLVGVLPAVVLAFASCGHHYSCGPQPAQAFSSSIGKSRPLRSRSHPQPQSQLCERSKLAVGTLYATLASEDTINVASDHKEKILESMALVVDEANQYADDFGLTHTEAAIYAVFAALRKAETPLGLKGEPFVLRRDEIMDALKLGADKPPFDNFFTMEHFSKAVEDDFLDAARGSTDNRKGWQITTVSTPRGESFEEARMTFEDVEEALKKGTVILNAIGAHVPKLAAPSLACTDATSLPNAINLYVTSAGTRTSAPPHTDKQDVVVVQTSGQKHWRVFNPTDSSRKPMADMFARGKGEDSLPLHQLLDSEDSINSADLLIETILKTGDILFIPAAFPHTTSTAHASDLPDATSVHLTFNIDTHVWQQDYLSLRRLALKRACVPDLALGQMNDSDNRYEGKANELPMEIRKELFDPLPMGYLDSADEETAKALQEKIVFEAKRISALVDEGTACSVDPQIWEDTVARLRREGMELLETHRDMYLAAIKEGRTREAEEAMTAHLDQSSSGRKPMSPERMQRLSLFRVKEYYDQMSATLDSLREWSLTGTSSHESASGGASAGKAAPLPENWAFTLPLNVGDQVEADLGGAFFDATVTRAAGNTYDVQFFDGDVETGLDRSMLKLKSPPAATDDDVVDTSNMTPKQLKRWRKEQKKKKK